MATSEPLEEVETDVFSIRTPPAGAEAVMRRFSQPHVRFIGSHTGCSCGFPSVMADEPLEYFDGMFNHEDAAERLKDLRSVGALLEVIRACLKDDNTVELFPVWAGDETEEPAGVIELQVQQLEVQTFFFNEHYLYRIRSAPPAA